MAKSSRLQDSIAKAKRKRKTKTNQNDKEILEMIDYWNMSVRKAKNLKVYKVIKAKDPTTSKIYTHFEKMYKICKENNWDCKVYIDSQFERVRHFNSDIDVPTPDLCHSPNAKKAYVAYVRDKVQTSSSDNNFITNEDALKYKVPSKYDKVISYEEELKEIYQKFADDYREFTRIEQERKYNLLKFADDYNDIRLLPKSDFKDLLIDLSDEMLKVLYLQFEVSNLPKEALILLFEKDELIKFLNNVELTSGLTLDQFNFLKIYANNFNNEAQKRYFTTYTELEFVNIFKKTNTPETLIRDWANANVNFIKEQIDLISKNPKLDRIEQSFCYYTQEDKLTKQDKREIKQFLNTELPNFINKIKESAIKTQDDRFYVVTRVLKEIYPNTIVTEIKKLYRGLSEDDLNTLPRLPKRLCYSYNYRKIIEDIDSSLLITSVPNLYTIISEDVEQINTLLIECDDLFEKAYKDKFRVMLQNIRRDENKSKRRVARRKSESILDEHNIKIPLNAMQDDISELRKPDEYLFVIDYLSELAEYSYSLDLAKILKFVVSDLQKRYDFNIFKETTFTFKYLDEMINDILHKVRKDRKQQVKIKLSDISEELFREEIKESTEKEKLDNELEDVIYSVINKRIENKETLYLEDIRHEVLNDEIGCKSVIDLMFKEEE